MKLIPYAVLTGLPVVGKALAHALNPFWIHGGESSLSMYSKEDQEKIRRYHEAHPDEVITRMLLGKILKDR